MTWAPFTCEQIARAALGEPLKPEGKELLWPCPHAEKHRNGDAHPSFKVNPSKNIWGCFVCGASGTAWQLAAFIARLDPGDKPGVNAWLKERGLLNTRGPAKALSGRGPCAAEYLYRDTTGNPAARKLRFEPGANGRKKDFVWQRWENGAWVDGLADLKMPLYRLPEIQNEPFVILTEGEKDADAGAKIGLPTTTSGGVSSFRGDHADALCGKHVVIVADADDPGREHVQKVAAMLYGKARSVRVCEIPGSKDLAEAIEKGVQQSVLLALFQDTPEWKPLEASEILDSTLRFIRRFVALTENQASVVALWIAHTHAMDAADCTPYLSVNSAEKQSGKTRLLELLELLVARPWLTGRVTAAVLIRKIDNVKPSLLLDESDTAFRGEKEYAEALRGVLNTGYRCGGKASCCVGQGANITFQDFSTFCPKAIAGIGGLPDTVADRSISIRLKRAKHGEVQKFRKREVEREGNEIKAKLAATCTGTNIEKLRDARPDVPSELSDRQADCCEPLIAIADLAGGAWPQAVRRALVALCAEAQADDQSIGVRLLADILSIFSTKKADRISSVDLVEALTAIETSPWAELSHGKPITAPKLARLLAPFGVAPDSVRFDGGTRKGYLLQWFEDAFSRYLPPLRTEKRNTGTMPINMGENADLLSGTRSGCSVSENAEKLHKNGPCSVVPLSKPGNTADEAEIDLRASLQ
jgi:hypothetical protein